MKTDLTLKAITDILEKTGLSQTPIAEECFNKFNSLDVSYENIPQLLKQKHPLLFNRYLINDSSEKNQIKMQETLQRHREAIEKLVDREEIDDFLSSTELTKETIATELNTFIDSGKYKVEDRIKTSDSLRTNIERGNPYTLMDIVGFRVVPNSNSDFVNLVHALEEKLTSVHFKINVLSYSYDEALQNIGPASVYYKAIHYHLVSDPYTCEIQVRGKYTDLWAALSHVSLYKPLIQLEDSEKLAVMEFGRLANVVDFCEFLNGDLYRG